MFGEPLDFIWLKNENGQITYRHAVWYNMKPVVQVGSCDAFQ